MDCAIVIGHTSVHPGADNHASGSDRVTEFTFNERLGLLVSAGLCDLSSQVVYRPAPNEYDELPTVVNALYPEFVVCLHANSHDSDASGTETLYWWTSTKGKRLASMMQEEIVKVLGLRDRGTRARQTGDRGALILRETAAPCVILEPFFISNPEDLALATAKLPELVEALKTGIVRFHAWLHLAGHER